MVNRMEVTSLLKWLPATELDVRKIRPLSNLYKLDEPIPDREFPTLSYYSVEHAYVASKSLSPTIRKHVSSIQGDNPEYWGMPALKYGRGLSPHPDWDSAKLSIMEHYLRLKFAQPRFKEFLLATNRQMIWETGHKFWGIPGENHLGKLIMKIRGEIRDLDGHFFSMAEDLQE